jgi:hypothetical protein
MTGPVAESLHVRVNLSTALEYVGEDALRTHISEWRDSVEVGDSITISDLCAFDSSTFPGRTNPAVETVTAFVFSCKVDQVDGIASLGTVKRAVKVATTSGMSAPEY